MQNAEGKQLMLEAVALIGGLLLALDRQIHGTIRERVVVAYYRLKGGAQVSQHSSHALSTALAGLACPWLKFERRQEEATRTQSCAKVALLDPAVEPDSERASLWDLMEQR